jgi:Tfp pilus assembly protein PilV
MRFLNRIKRVNGNQQGFGLAETLVAVAILGTAVAAFVAALGTGAISTGEQEREVIAQRLAQNQIESIKNQPFSAPGVYSLVTTPSGYTINVNTGAVPGANTNIQKITVTVQLNGSGILTVSDYKVNR